MIGALVLDFDGLVLDTEGSIFASWQWLYEQCGAPLTVEEWAHSIGTEGAFDPPGELARRIGRPLTGRELDARRAHRDALLAREDVLPGVHAWLDEAGRLGLPTAIASSSPRDWVEPHLTRIGLRDRFACIVCRDAGAGIRPKPAPDVFVHAAASIGIDPSHALAVDDSPHGIAAARAAGMRTVAVPTALTRHLDYSTADLLLTSLAHSSLAEAIATLRVH